MTKCGRAEGPISCENRVTAILGLLQFAEAQPAFFRPPAPWTDGARRKRSHALHRLLAGNQRLDVLVKQLRLALILKSIDPFVPLSGSFA